VSDGIDWTELSELKRIASLGEKSPEHLQSVFGTSMFKTFLRCDGQLVGAGRALAEGLDSAYIADVAIQPDHQRIGLETAIVRRLVSLASGNTKMLLYANPGREGFCAKLGFLPMNTARAICVDTSQAMSKGLVRPFQK
jgi:predicted GNAT family acetyltransferase